MNEIALKICTAVLVLLSMLPGAPVHAQCAAPKNVGGSWTGNDQGKYWVHVVGNTIWWMGGSADNGAAWTNVFKGTRNGDFIEGEWADVRGNFWGHGTLKLRIVGTTYMEKVGATGSNFGGTRWGRGGCPDTVGVGVH